MQRIGTTIMMATLAAAGVVSISAVVGRQTASRPTGAPTSSPERLTVQSDGHPMAVWARKPASPRGVILLVHGRTWSSRPDFDLQVPGLQRSVMQSFAAQGVAAYAVDLRGYGETPRDATGWLTPRRAATDIVNVVTWLGQQHPALPRPVMVGWSRGAAATMMAAQMAPARVSGLVVFGFAFDPDLEFVDVTVPDKPQMDKNTRESAMSDFISPRVTPPAMVQAFVDQALRADPVLMDLKNDMEFNVLAPEKLTTPTLVLFGEHDPGVRQEDAAKFWAALATQDKQLVMLPGADHAAQIEDTHDAWIAAIVSFMTRPGARR